VPWLFLLSFFVFAQTATPSATIVPTPTTIIDPTTKIFITEISPTSDTEFTEIYNANDNTVKLTKWKVQTETTTRNLLDNSTISPNSYLVFNSSGLYNDSVSKIAKIVNQDGSPIDTITAYPAALDNGLSWSKQSDDTWCQTFPSSGQPNKICYVPPSPIPPSPSPVPSDSPDPTDAPIPINTPVPTSIPSLTPTKIPTPTLFPTVTPDPLPSYDPLPTNDPPSQILGVSETKSTLTLSPALIPTIFIIVGAGLLLIPLIISKIKFRRR